MTWTRFEDQKPSPGKAYIVAYTIPHLGNEDIKCPHLVGKAWFCCTEGWKLDGYTDNWAVKVIYWAQLPEWPHDMDSK